MSDPKLLVLLPYILAIPLMIWILWRSLRDSKRRPPH